MGIERWVQRMPHTPIKKPDHDSLMVVPEGLKGVFEGPAQVLFQQMLRCIGLQLEQVYIAGDNLDEAIARVKPRAILKYVHTLEGTMPTAETHYQGIAMITSYSPAHLLRSPQDKKHAYRDLLRIQLLLSSCSSIAPEA